MGSDREGYGSRRAAGTDDLDACVTDGSGAGLEAGLESRTQTPSIPLAADKPSDSYRAFAPIDPKRFEGLFRWSETKGDGGRVEGYNVLIPSKGPKEYQVNFMTDGSSFNSGKVFDCLFLFCGVIGYPITNDFEISLKRSLGHLHATKDEDDIYSVQVRILLKGDILTMNIADTAVRDEEIVLKEKFGDYFNSYESGGNIHTFTKVLDKAFDDKGREVDRTKLEARTAAAAKRSAHADGEPPAWN